MKKSKLIYALSAVAVMTLSSCSGFLDKPTDTRVELTTPEQLRMLLNASYPSYNYAWPCELMSDNMEDNNSPDDDNMRYNLSPYNRGDDEMFRFEQCVSASGSDTPSGIWEGFYNSIAAANHVLEQVEKLEAAQAEGTVDETLSAVKGEALMLRAFNHFVLAQVFCQPYGGPEKSKSLLGIPYVTKPESTVKPHYERPSLAYTYDMIVADFETALPLINNGIYSVPKYHFNTSAAYAFGARLALFMRQYKKAFNYANMAFGAPRVDDVESVDFATAVDAAPFLADTYSKLGQFYYLSDVGLYQNGIDKQANFLLYPTYSILVRHLTGGRYGVIRNALNSTIHGASPSWRAMKWVSKNGKGGSFTMHPCFNGCSYINQKSDYGVWCGVNVQEFFEYTDKIAGIGYPHVTKREFFGEETLFVRAEARLFLGDTQGALADLDLWEKNRRNCPSASGLEDAFVDLTEANIQDFYVNKVPENREQTSGSDSGYGIAKQINIDVICPESDATVSAASVEGMLQCIQHFRRIETLHTGLRWFDIKRLGLEYAHKVGKDADMYHLSVEDPRKAIQIPADVVAAGMQPNPRLEDLDRVNSTEQVEFVRRPDASIRPNL